MLLKRSLSVHLPRYDTAKVKARKQKVQKKAEDWIPRLVEILGKLKMLLACKEQEVK